MELVFFGDVIFSYFFNLVFKIMFPCFWWLLLASVAFGGFCWLFMDSMSHMPAWWTLCSRMSIVIVLLQVSDFLRHLLAEVLQ